MSGLLDMQQDFAIDPEELKRQQRAAFFMNLAGGLLGARRGQEMQGLGGGLLGGFQGAQSVKGDMLKQQMQAMQMRSMGMDYATKKDAFDTQQKVNEAMRNYQPPSALQSAMSAAPSLAPTPQNVAQVTSTAQGSGEYERLLNVAKYLESKGMTQQALPYYAQAEKYAPQYDKTETLMQDGKPVVVQQFKNRAPQTLPGYQPKPNYEKVTDNQTTSFRDPLTGQSSPIGNMQMLTTPDANLGAQTSARGQDITMRGQNMTDARARDTQAQTERHFQTTQAAPVWDQAAGVFITKPTAGKPPSAIPVAGMPDKPLTEVQGNATAFGMRAKSANDTFAQLEQSGAPVSSPVSKLAKNSVTNYAAPEWAQKAEQAKLNFMSATLRKESGAAISNSEYEQEDKKYFPQPGDSPAVMEQKRKARALAINTLEVQAGPGKKNIGAGGWSIKPVQ